MSSSYVSLNALGTSKDDYKTNPEENANIFSIITFHFMSKLMKIGVKKPLMSEDVYPICQCDKASTLYESFQHYWNPHTSTTQDKYKGRSLLGALNSEYGWKFHTAFLLKLGADASEYVYPLMIYKLTNFVEDKDEPYWHGLVYTAFLLLAYLLNTFLLGLWEYRVYRVAFNVRSALTSAIYKKSLSISNATREKDNKGKGNLVNLITVDVDAVAAMIEFVHFAMTIPFQMLASVYLLYRLLGYSALIGFSTLLLFVPLNIYSAIKQSDLATEVMKRKDVRTSQVAEAINSIRVLKFYGWMKLMYDRIMMLRSEEVKQYRKMFIFNSFLYLLWFLLPDFVTVTTYCVYALFGNQLDMSIIIASLSLFFIIQFPLSLLPHVIATTSVSMVSVRRIETFLRNKELEKPFESLSGTTSFGTVDPDFETKNLALSITDASFIWKEVDAVDEEDDESGDDKDKDDSASKSKKKQSSKAKGKGKDKDESKQNLLINDDVSINNRDGLDDPFKVEESCLTDITLSVPQGSLTVVVGPVGSGKSSLLSAMLGDMTVVKGGLSRIGTVAYVSQLPWIMNGTLRDNVLFGSDYDEEKYQHTLNVCSLQPDIELLAKGDLSQIGEKGINLSGGQKMRLSIARAVYNDAEILILDDPLASLDIHVAQSVFQQAILPLVPKKTVILVTHQLFPLEFSSQIITMSDGRVENIGKYDQLSKESWEIYQFKNAEAKKEDEARKEKEKKDEEEEEEEDEDDDDDLIIEEERNTGKVTYKEYLTYLGKIGVGFVSMTFILSMVAPGLSVFGNWWLTHWSQEWDKKDHPSLLYYLGIYFLSSIGMSLCVFLISLLSMFGGLSASQGYHKQALDHVLNSPIQFFDQNPSGRIINRFSKDVSKLDDALPNSMRSSNDSFMRVMAIIIMIAIASPIVLVLLIPIAICMWVLKNWFINNARELQRLTSVTLSPVISHFTETLSGQQIIRAYSSSDRFLKLMMDKVDENTRMTISEEWVSQWAFLRLGILCSAFVACTALSATFLRGHLSPALIGLALSYAVTMTGELNWMFVQFTLVETEMNSVERLQHYCDLTKEAPAFVKDNQVPPSWPNAGRITFKNYSMRYRPELPPSLSNINLSIEPGSKVGICGRTGAGKSSLLLGLFRLVESSEGYIEIDGYDTSKIGLQDLRTQMSIIPQDPVLFAGTLRYNLDPFDSSTDSEIWDILERVHMKDKIKSLDALVTEDGGNFSVGQRQLLCLAGQGIAQEVQDHCAG
ncbi:hypothetical protein SAMD00019534_002300 [Acytostelium subglobosum LB1]|uniref:hypothetical protein n=1 Tax=Acytostelium subglobosum LB1 TaxID=1410327 RepID=UPI000644B6DE|nr:hypothetical protein SAMD00019534_002300 [Acytostelium subglobosum LB1]GAM17055.1 hypothetical protein SAMD00019534_002300 [Acytostelium subglobosum LB1]|eukprot:XP_012759117.1 hypothetical protein SAMD00019534_002300 [Acytostelium subglobosum LB1]